MTLVILLSKAARPVTLKSRGLQVAWTPLPWAQLPPVQWPPPVLPLALLP
jgi:hypothetical protein